MKMKITRRVLSIPPYLSTTWDQIGALQVEIYEGHPTLIVELVTGTRIEVPHLEDKALDAIFSIHASIADNTSGNGQTDTTPATSPTHTAIPISLTLPLQEGSGHFAGLLRHSPEGAGLPDLPTPILERVIEVAQHLGIDDPALLATPEDGCNCMHCQIVRTIQQTIATRSTQMKEGAIEEEVSAEDLRFRTWDIDQEGNNLYKVSNPLDQNEHYSVYLGQPIGCTCGHRNCEHVRAVLLSG